MREIKTAKCWLRINIFLNSAIITCGTSFLPSPDIDVYREERLEKDSVEAEGQENAFAIAWAYVVPLISLFPFPIYFGMANNYCVLM